MSGTVGYVIVGGFIVMLIGAAITVSGIAWHLVSLLVKS